MPRVNTVNHLRGRTVAQTALYEIRDEVNAWDLDDRTREELEVRLESVVEVYRDFLRHQDEIEKTRDIDMDDQDALRAEVRNVYYSVTASAKRLLGANAAPTAVTAEAPDTVRSPPTSEQKNVKLPDMRIEKFNGDIECWVTFRDVFTDTIHKIPDATLAPVRKLHYLKTFLTGEALDLIRELPTSDENYAVAWELVKGQYDNERRIIERHVARLFEVKPYSGGSGAALSITVSSFEKHYRALKNMADGVPLADALLVHLLSSKLNDETLRIWTRESREKKDFSFEAMLTCLKGTSTDLKTVEYSRSSGQRLEQHTKRESRDQLNDRRVKRTRNHAPSPRRDKTPSYAAKNIALPVAGRSGASCVFCKAHHQSEFCDKASKMTVEARKAVILREKRCLNCFRLYHMAQQCRSPPCARCGGRHNTTLHKHTSEPVQLQKEEAMCATNSDHIPVPAREGEVKCGSMCNCTHMPACKGEARCELQGCDSLEASGAKASLCASTSHSQVQSRTRRDAALAPVQEYHNFLMTALIEVQDDQKQWLKCRVLLDTGAQSNFVTEKMAQLLRLKREPVATRITGFGGTVSTLKHAIRVTFRSRFGNYQNCLSFKVAKQITGPIPSCTVSPPRATATLAMADPYFNRKSRVDMLIGSELFGELLDEGVVRKTTECPALINTVLGWVVTGPCCRSGPSRRFEETSCNLITDERIDEFIRKFWRIEELNPVSSEMSLSERKVEKFFEGTFARVGGRYQVRLPGSGEQLGHSYRMAERRFLSLERRLLGDEELKNAYVTFMRDYENAGHMRKVSNAPVTGMNFLPHHAVVTHKVRVVFDASAKTSNGRSLNDILLKGPTIQQELFWILIRFRKHRVALTGDIRQMYRQVKVDEDQLNLQCILWRECPEHPLETFQLTTVTYGTSPAPYLATRALQQLVLDEGDQFPMAKKAALTDFYVDDFISGADSIDETIQLRDQARELMARGGFQLVKWCSNAPEVLSGLDPGDIGMALEFDKDSSIKTLGLGWKPMSDQLFYKVPPQSSDPITKRTIYSSIARIFDPLGLLGPVILRSKVFMQTLWLEKDLGWDDPLEEKLEAMRKELRTSFADLQSVAIPRCVKPQVKVVRTQIHGFCDASKGGYGAAVYIRYEGVDGKIMTNLLCSKSRVSPRRQLTIPRLELCGAVVLAELMTVTLAAYDDPIDQVALWSDSTVVLQWIKTESRSLKTFVGNRVARIQELTHGWTWRHVPTNFNPADILSRGASPRELAACEIWWHGPEFLAKSSSQWPETSLSFQPDTSELSVLIATSEPVSRRIWQTTFDLHRLVRIQAYCLRFVKNTRPKRYSRVSGPLTVPELNASHLSLLKWAQEESFSAEIHCVAAGKELPTRSKLLGLAPYIKDGLLRVGGRLENSHLPPDAKHQVVLPGNHHLTRAIMSSMHTTMLHCGPQSLLSAVRQRYWPLKGRALARQVTRSCVTCVRARPKCFEHIMAPLPAARVTPNRPFYHAGVDYAGPFLLKRMHGRSPILDKVWMAVFVCMATKAVHLELVSSLSTASYMAAMHRFVARRGKPGFVWSDNGTNFHGACNELRELYASLKGNENTIIGSLAEDGIEWKFIPAYSPHFGGLWEAAVRSAKSHIKRAIGEQHLTYEEFTTLLCRVEACLNSRPLTALSADPNDLNALTPGHFLTGAPLMSLPGKDHGDINLNRLERWERVHQIQQRFWKRWSCDYLNHLQQRSTWKKTAPSPATGQLVVIKQEKLPPQKWALGRIVELVRGADGVVRTVRVRTASGVITRAIRGLCPLPVEA